MTLLCVPLVLSAPCLWLSQAIRAKNRERAAAKTILRAGGSIKCASGRLGVPPPASTPRILAPILGADFFDNAVEASLRIPAKHELPPFAILNDLPRLQVLFLTSAAVDDGELSQLEGFEELEVIYLQRSRVSDRGLAFLRNCPRLREIDVSDTDVSGTSFGELTELPRLETIWMTGCQITDDGACAIGRLRYLSFLTLCDAEISDAGMASIAGLSALEVLNLNMAKITDRRLRELAKCKTLRELSLCHAQIDDDSIAAICELKQLSNLDLIETGISDAGMRRLRQALPKCHIIDRAFNKTAQ